MEIQSPSLIEKLYLRVSAVFPINDLNLYLVEHQQFVFSNNSESSQLKVPCSIPQRSTVGLLLY